jgi:hypothetical protein
MPEHTGSWEISECVRKVSQIFRSNSVSGMAACHVFFTACLYVSSTFAAEQWQATHVRRCSYNGRCTGVFKLGVRIEALQHGIETSLGEFVKVHGVDISRVNVFEDLGEDLDLILLGRTDTEAGDEKPKIFEPCPSVFSSSSSTKFSIPACSNTCARAAEDQADRDHSMATVSSISSHCTRGASDVFPFAAPHRVRYVPRQQDQASSQSARAQQGRATSQSKYMYGR